MLNPKIISPFNITEDNPYNPFNKYRKDISQDSVILNSANQELNFFNSIASIKLL